MRKRFSPLLAVLVMLGLGRAEAGDGPAAPRLPRRGSNLVPNAAVKTPAKWSLFGDARYDPGTSRSRDGSGSFLLQTPGDKGSKAFSDFIPVKAGTTYTYGFYVKTAGGPTLAGGQIAAFRRDRSFIRNIASGRVSTARDGDWEEAAIPVSIPKEAAFVRVEVFKMENTQPGGRAWGDDFYFGEGIGLEQPPSPKKAFDGSHVRVDSLGNFEVNRNGTWTPFFPLCIASDNSRDWKVYSAQGWNAIIWAGAPSQVWQARDAKSPFNPDGMLAGFSIAPYMFPSGSAYNKLDDLRSKLKEILDQGLADNLLLYFWDNENNHEQWKVPVDVVDTIKRLDVDASGKRRHPIYALQGQFNVARLHAARGLVDVSGTYVGGDPDVGGAGKGNMDGLLFLDRLPGQVSPAAFAQLNGVDEPGEMRLRLYDSILLGAKAISYWRDCYKGCDEKFMKSVGPVDQKPWWPDFPNLRREVDRLLPLIRQPHWTTWSAKVDPPDGVRVGTRELDGEAYLIAVNQTAAPRALTLRIEGLPYTAKEARSYFDAAKSWPVRDGSIALQLGGIGVDSGTLVLRLPRAD